MQETYLKIRSAAHLYVPMGKSMAWILTIARNICMMKFRQRKHDSILPFEEIKDIPDCSKIEDIEDRLVLETVFHILSREECQIIILHAVSGLKHREISTLLNMPLSTVRTMIRHWFGNYFNTVISQFRLKIRLACHCIRKSPDLFNTVAFQGKHQYLRSGVCVKNIK